MASLFNISSPAPFLSRTSALPSPTPPSFKPITQFKKGLCWRWRLKCTSEEEEYTESLSETTWPSSSSSSSLSSISTDNWSATLGEDDFSDQSAFSSEESGFIGREEEKNYDKDPEFAEILGSCLDDPKIAQNKMEERLRKKRNKVLHTKTGSAEPMKVTFNKFSFSNSYIWFEFYNAPLEKDVTLICDAIRSWHIVGRLGGCNSMNMQLSQSTFDRRPNYDAIQGANVSPTTFYNIGDFEVQDNLARIWVDIGTTEPLILDVLINALTHISSDYVGIKQLAFGGSEFENWNENLTSEDTGYSVHKI